MPTSPIWPEKSSALMALSLVNVAAASPSLVISAPAPLKLIAPDPEIV